MEGLAFVDGRIKPLAEATVPLMDRGYLLGDGVFETLRSSDGRLFRPDLHEERLRHGLRVLGLDTGLASSWRQALDALHEAGRSMADDLYLRVQVTSGVLEEDLAGAGASVTGICKPLRPYPMQYYAKGVRCILAGRKDEHDPLSTVKSLSFAPYLAARRRAYAAAVHDAVLVNQAGRIAEASTSNVVAVKDDVVYAPGPEEGALAGVTRDVVLGLLEDIGLDVEKRLEADTLRAADEAWLTNTTGGVVPLVRLDDHPIGHGKGPLAASLQASYERLVHGDA